MTRGFGISVAVEVGVSAGGIRVGAIVADAKRVGLGTSAYAHRFSCVGVRVAKRGLTEALAEDVTKKKRRSPRLRSNGVSRRTGKR
jgi:hypothetical protein